MQVVDFEHLGLVIVNRGQDFVAPKTCAVGEKPLLTAGGERVSFGGPNKSADVCS